MKGTLLRIGGWIVALAAIAVAVVAYVRWKKNAAAAEPKWRTARVERGKIASRVTATGTLSARVTVLVGTQVSGRVQEIFVDFNSPVKKGQVIAKIDPRLFQATVQKARAAYIEAQAAVTKAKANAAQAERAFERAKKLHDQGLMGLSDYELAETAVASTKADIAVANGRLAAASASLNEAEVNLGFTTIHSPIDGIVISRSVDVGQTVAASLQSPTLFTIAQDLKNIQVDTFVAEADVGKLKQGMEATFTVDAYPGTKFKGVVREVRNAAQTVQNVVTYDAVVDVNNDELKLKPGMTANVTFVWAEKDDVLKVPNAALRFRPPPEALAGMGSGSAGPRRPRGPGGPGGAGSSGDKGDDVSRRVVWVLRNDKPVPVRVEAGISDGTSTEVVKGELGEGDDVILEYVAPADGASTQAKPLGPSGGGRRTF